ncbi:tetratricopeptide repeat protein [Nostoc sp. ChiSLP03a]|uniref:tetratricopeptide repeat protein n=1 Tax=Nostoc sp. ChiSLP03a TaxID=3075380 RepID=UPI002AD552F1|nr:tetratricopeptide repeat protein [Nostoc sp. ChiSLP03a]MDZ8211476.1 tetratricopeptide repeat protein [Nostoc sp. ChiSLP03a]
MAEEPNASNPNKIEMNATAHGDSKVTMVGQLNTTEVKFFVDDIQPILERLQQISPPESPGVLKAGNPGKSLAYWQGRTAEIAQIQQWLTDQNTFLIGIEGIGGTGKSMLAAKIYDEIASFPKRFWADVSNGAGFSDLARQVLTEFGFLVPEKEAQLVEALVRCLRSGQFLLIIDNLESLLQPNRQWGSLFYGDFFQAWVEHGSNSKVLVTTRERPELKGFEWLPLKGLQVDEGVALLTVLSIRGDLTQFVELVDGHPLLLRLVADLLKEEYSQDPNLSRLADLGLGNLRQLLTDSQVVGIHRRENVGMVLVLDASFNRLNELQKALLLNISVYRGAVYSAAAVAVLPGNSAAEIERELRNLVKRSLLVDKLNGKRRFEFQPVVLEYARYQAGNQTEAHQQAINYYLLNVKQPPWHTKVDIKEYLEIFYHRYQLENYDSAFDILEACDNFLTLRGYYTDQVYLYKQLIEAWEKTRQKEHWIYLASLTNLGSSYYSLGDYSQAIKFCQQSCKIAQEIDYPDVKATSLNVLGLVYRQQEQYKQAIEFFEQSLKIVKEIKKIHYGNLEAKLLGNLGNAYQSLGESQQAIEFHERSLELAQELGDSNWEASCLGNLGNYYQGLKEYKQAIEFHQQQLKIVKDIDIQGEINCLGNLGIAYRCLGQYQQAIEFQQRSLEIAREIGDRYGEAIAWYNLGLSLENVNRESDALGAYRNASELYQQMGLDAKVQDCNNAIERLSQPKTPVVSRRGFWAWLRRLWRWVRSWFRR